MFSKKQGDSKQHELSQYVTLEHVGQNQVELIGPNWSNLDSYSFILQFLVFFQLLSFNFQQENK